MATQPLGFGPTPGTPNLLAQAGRLAARAHEQAARIEAARDAAEQQRLYQALSSSIATIYQAFEQNLAEERQDVQRQEDFAQQFELEGMRESGRDARAPLQAMTSMLNTQATQAGQMQRAEMRELMAAADHTAGEAASGASAGSS